MRFEDPKRAAATITTVSEQHLYKLCDDGDVVAFAQVARDRSRPDSADLLQISSLTEQFQFVAILWTNSNDGAGPGGVRRGGEEVSDSMKAERVDKEAWDPDRMITAAESKGIGL